MLGDLFHNDKDKYSYAHCRDSTSKAVDVHEIFIERSRVRLHLSHIGILICLANCYILLVKDYQQRKLSNDSIWKIFVVLLFAKFVQYKPVKKEAILIFRDFGVQLETHYWSGRIVHRFVPRGKILKPVLNECVTPFTCYWSLALILYEEDQLMPAFQEMNPPLQLLLPIWKALSSSSFDVNGGSSSFGGADG